MPYRVSGGQKKGLVQYLGLNALEKALHHMSTTFLFSGLHIDPDSIEIITRNAGIRTSNRMKTAPQHKRVMARDIT